MKDLNSQIKSQKSGGGKLGAGMGMGTGKRSGIGMGAAAGCGIAGDNYKGKGSKGNMSYAPKHNS